MSDTDYFFAVFPTIELEDSFDFTFQPDRLKNACHYIFHAKNPVNWIGVRTQSSYTVQQASMLVHNTP